MSKLICGILLFFCLAILLVLWIDNAVESLYSNH